MRTCPSVLKTLEEECKAATPIEAYRNEVTKVPPSTHLSVKQPRSIKQVKNIRSRVLEDFRLSHDGIINLHELAIDLPDFIHSIHTHPNLICICGHKVLFNELDRVLLVDSPDSQLLSYDTTFQLGDFYVSVLSFRHVLFKECPAIPVGFVFHERKFQSVHGQFFDLCCKLAPGLKTTAHPIVTDEEQGIVNAIASHLQSSTNVIIFSVMQCAGFDHMVHLQRMWAFIYQMLKIFSIYHHNKSIKLSFCSWLKAFAHGSKMECSILSVLL